MVTNTHSFFSKFCIIQFSVTHPEAQEAASMNESLQVDTVGQFFKPSEAHPNENSYIQTYKYTNKCLFVYLTDQDLSIYLVAKHV